MDTIYKESGSHWSQQVSAMATTQCLQCDQTLSLSAKGVSCKTVFFVVVVVVLFLPGTDAYMGTFPLLLSACIVKCGVSCSLLGGPW